MRTFAMTFSFVVFSTVCSAEDLQPSIKCLTIHQDAARLACFDRALGYVPPKTDDVGVNDGVGWILIENKDEFNGSNTSRVYVEETGREGAYDAAVLSVGCKDDGTYGVLFYKRSFINTNYSIKVRYRFDENEPISENWHGTTGSNGAILPNNFRDFRTQLAEANKVVFEAVDYQGARHRHTFEGLARNERDLQFVMNGCKADQKN